MIARSLDLPPGMIHRDSEPCPFRRSSDPVDVDAFSTCCSFRGTACVLYLVAMHFAPIAMALYADKSPGEATEFAKDLRSAVRILRKALDDVRKPPDWRPVLSVNSAGWEFRFAQAFETIERAAIWHEKIAELGFGVRVRS